MFANWLKTKLRNTQIKMVTQNDLAANHLFLLAEMRASVRDPNADSMKQGLQNELAIIALAKVHLMLHWELSERDNDFQLALYGKYRLAYGDALIARKAFADQYGSSREPLVSFDRKFTPNVGWKIHYKHFGK